jgi:hypothetical protein
MVRDDNSLVGGAPDCTIGSHVCRVMRLRCHERAMTYRDGRSCSSRAWLTLLHEVSV